jgi:hypothetical protein
MDKIDYTLLSLDELKKHGAMRWGRTPATNVWIMPGTALKSALPGQTWYGIDGKPYVIGIQPIDTVLLYGYLAYGVKIESDTAPGKPELPPEKLFELSQGRQRRLIHQANNNRGTFIPE